MQLVLVMFRAEGERRSFSLTKDVTTIGRREDCDLRIPVSEVSRKHCRVIMDGDSVRVEDLGSSNGTFHNGQRIQGSAVVEPGDSVQVGPVVFVVQVDGVPADEELVPFTERAAHDLEGSVADEEALDAGGDANTAAENIDEIMVTPGAGGSVAELEPLPLEDDLHALPMADGEPAAGHADDPDASGAPAPLGMADSSAGSGTGMAIDLADDDGSHAPLSEDELLLDLKDDKNDRH